MATPKVAGASPEIVRRWELSFPLKPGVWPRATPSPLPLSLDEGEGEEAQRDPFSLRLFLTLSLPLLTSFRSVSIAFSLPLPHRGRGAGERVRQGRSVCTFPRIRGMHPAPRGCFWPMTQRNKEYESTIIKGKKQTPCFFLVTLVSGRHSPSNPLSHRGERKTPFFS